MLASIYLMQEMEAFESRKVGTTATTLLQWINKEMKELGNEGVNSPITKMKN